MKYEFLGTPCRNFCILASTVIRDPKDKVEKMVLSSFVSGGTGRIILLNPYTGEGESIEIPGDEGAWALYCLNGEKLLVGTCGLQGLLHCLDLRTRKWEPTLHYGDETYIWTLVGGSDGKIYGGTYPGGLLLRYDPDTHTLENIGKMSRDSENLYTRPLSAAVPGKILVSCSNHTPEVAIYDIATGNIDYLGGTGVSLLSASEKVIVLDRDGQKEFYDPQSFQKLEGYQPDEVQDPRIPLNAQFVRFSDGLIAGVKGQEYFLLKPQDSEPSFHAIPVEAPPTQILTMAADLRGAIWGSSNFGQTIFRYDLATKKEWNSLTVCDRGGEVYGIQIIGGRVFMAAYAGGDHIVYDPEQPWDQAANRNPKTLEQVAPALVRPHGKSTIGPDGAFWTGWSAKYGVYGGGLSRVDPDTLAVTSWYDPIPEQEIASITADDQYLYFTTDGLANGLAEKKDEFCFAVWDPVGKLCWHNRFPLGQVPGQVLAVNGQVLVSVDNKLLSFCRETLSFENKFAQFPAKCSCLVPYRRDTVAVFAGTELYLLNTNTMTAQKWMDLPGVVKTAVVAADGELYFAQTDRLYRAIHA